MEELREFFGLNIVHNRPRLIIFNDRKTIDMLKRTKTEPWLVGWTDNLSFPISVYILSKDNFENESNHKYSDEEYYCLIKHELAHVFCDIISQANKKGPQWFWEGIAIYVSGQTALMGRKVDKLTEFLSYYSEGGSGIYKESGFAIKYLVETYGKEKLLRLIESFKSGIGGKDEFDNVFERIYGFKPTYSAFEKA